MSAFNVVSSLRTPQYRGLLASLASLVAMPLVFASGAAAGDPTSAGELAFNNHCRECHTVDKGDNRIGPTLFNAIGRKAGSVPDYGNYSSAVQDSGVIWEPATLDKWITNAQAFLPDNNMQPFPGVDKPGDRALIIAYLKSKSGQ